MTQDRPRTVALKKNLARSIRQGHPWIYRDALSVRVAPEDGAVVEVRTRDKRPVARGFWDARSPIARGCFGTLHRVAHVESNVTPGGVRAPGDTECHSRTEYMCPWVVTLTRLH